MDRGEFVTRPGDQSVEELLHEPTCALRKGDDQSAFVQGAVASQKGICVHEARRPNAETATSPE
jgi:hypothetical protein